MGCADPSAGHNGGAMQLTAMVRRLTEKEGWEVFHALPLRVTTPYQCARARGTGLGDESFGF